VGPAGAAWVKDPVAVDNPVVLVFKERKIELSGEPHSEILNKPL